MEFTIDGNYKFNIPQMPLLQRPYLASKNFIAIKGEDSRGNEVAIRLFKRDDEDSYCEFLYQKSSNVRSDYIVTNLAVYDNVAVISEDKAKANIFSVIITNYFKGDKVIDLLNSDVGLKDSYIVILLAQLSEHIDNIYDVNYFNSLFDGMASPKKLSFDVNTIRFTLEQSGGRVYLADIGYTSNESETTICASNQVELMAKLHYYFLNGEVCNDLEQCRYSDIIGKILAMSPVNAEEYYKDFNKLSSVNRTFVITGRNIMAEGDYGERPIALREPKSYLENKDIVEAAIYFSLKDSFNSLQLGENYYKKLDENFQMLSYQRDTALTFLNKFHGSGILADQVGMGKTIEAGMIISEYAKRRLISSLLIVAPSRLVEQWTEEMAEHFGLELQEIKSLDKLKKNTLGIMAFEIFRGDKTQNVSVDMIILDEAHRLLTKNKSAEITPEFCYKDKDGKSKRINRSSAFDKIRSINKKYSILISATPIKRTLLDLYPLIKLLKPGAYTNIQDYFIHGCFGNESVKDVLKNRDGKKMLQEIISNIAVRNTRKTANDIKWYKKVSHCYYFAGDNDILDVPGEMVYYREGQDAQNAKLSKLKEIILQYPKDKVIVFTKDKQESYDILSYLVDENREIFLIDPEKSTSDKSQQYNKFKASGSGVLLADNSLSEGKNIQFCHVMVNFSILHCPLLMEQRVGRIDRIGQTHDMQIYNFAQIKDITWYLLPFFDKDLQLFSQWNGDIINVVGDDEDGKSFIETVDRMWKDCSVDASRNWDDEWRKLVEEKKQLMDELADSNILFENDIEDDEAR